MPPKLIIFDCDGVLVDSEPIFNRVLHETLRQHGANMSLQEVTQTFTGKNRFAVEEHMKTLDLPLPDNWADAFYNKAIDVLSEQVEAIDGIHDALTTIAAHYIPICVASNGLTAKMNATLTKTKLMPFFAGKLYSSYDIGAGKPAPDVFLHAAREHQTAPADCIVVEDSPSGFKAAKAANMRCLAYVPHGTPDLQGATPFGHMSELPKLLGL